MTFLKLKQIAEHALGGAPDSRISKGHLVNEAIRHLYDAYTWSWRRKIADLASVNGTATVALPADFETLEAIEAPSASTLEVQIVQPDQLLRLIRDNTSYSDRIYAAFVGGDSASLWQRKLRVYPVPTATASGYLTICYLAGFTRFTETDSATTNDADLAPVPAAFEGVLADLVRAKAKSEDADDPTNLYWQLATQKLGLLMLKDQQATPPVISTMQTSQRRALGGYGEFSVPEGPVTFE